MILNYLDVSNRGEYDETFESGRVVKRWDEHVRCEVFMLYPSAFCELCSSAQTMLMYMLFETPTRLVAQRETLTVVNWYVDADRTTYLVAKSVESPDVPCPSSTWCRTRQLLTSCYGVCVWMCLPCVQIACGPSCTLVVGYSSPLTTTCRVKHRI
jgi:hypothetical protein